MARLLSVDGEEICSLARLRVDARLFTALMAPHLATHHAITKAILENDEGRRYLVVVDRWELLTDGHEPTGYVRGTIVVEATGAAVRLKVPGAIPEEG